MAGNGDANEAMVRLTNGYHYELTTRTPSPEPLFIPPRVEVAPPAVPQPIAPQQPPPIINREKRSREASRVVGTVKWFNAKVGYGFITRHDTGEDVFVHFTAISRKNPRHSIKSLGDGEIVEFNIVAVNVTGTGGGSVRGNPYVSYIPVRRNDSFAAGDTGMILPLRRYPHPRPLDFSASRIPRWAPMFRNFNF